MKGAIFMRYDELAHMGVKGMKWRRRKSKIQGPNDNQSRFVDTGEEITRIHQIRQKQLEDRRNASRISGPEAGDNRGKLKKEKPSVSKKGDKGKFNTDRKEPNRERITKSFDRIDAYMKNKAKRKK